MEKASNNNTKLTKMLQKALSIGHSAAPFSPARDYRHRRTISTANRGFLFSNSITPLLPATAKIKRKTKNDVVWAEPTSPKVSCIGQIKLSKQKCPEKKNRAHNKNLKTAPSSQKGSFLKLKRIFTTGKNPLTKSNSTAFAAAREHPVAAVAAPSLGKMKKFASSRESLGGFDWTVVTKQEETQSKDKEEEDVTIQWSMSLPLNQTESLSLCPKPKSEVNLWKRRAMDPPKPLQIFT
ncbi:unnamed protein product [Cochlearia groenlandica]